MLTSRPTLQYIDIVDRHQSFQNIDIWFFEHRKYQAHATEQRPHKRQLYSWNNSYAMTKRWTAYLWVLIDRVVQGGYSLGKQFFGEN